MSTGMTIERFLFLSCSFLIVSIPVAVYSFFGIYFLYHDVDVCYSYSPLWIYGVVTFSFIVLSIPFRFFLARIDYGKKVREYFGSIHPALKPDWVIWFPIWLAWLTYGAVVIYGGLTCDAMKTHGLWIWALVSFWLNAGIAMLLFLFFCCSCMQKRLYSDERSSDEERESLRV